MSVTPFGSHAPLRASAAASRCTSPSATGPPQQVTTTDDANGDFSYTATRRDKGRRLRLQRQHRDVLHGARRESVPIGQNQVQSTLAVTPDPGKRYRGIAERHVRWHADRSVPGRHDCGADPERSRSTSASTAPPRSPVGTTDVNGDFTYKVSGVSQKTAYAFSVASSGTYTQATDDITVAVDQARTRISHIQVIPAHLEVRTERDAQSHGPVPEREDLGGIAAHRGPPG